MPSLKLQLGGVESNEVKVKASMFAPCFLLCWRSGFSVGFERCMGNCARQPDLDGKFLRGDVKGQGTLAKLTEQNSC